MMRAMTCKGVIDNIPPSDLISGIILPTCISVAVPSVFNPRRACAARVTVVALCVCVCVCVCVCLCVCVSRPLICDSRN